MSRIESAGPRTAVAAALVAAGYQPPFARLLAIAVSAWTRYPGAAGQGARVGVVREALSGEMTFRMVEETLGARVLAQAIEVLLLRAAETIAAQRPETGAGREPAAAGGGQSMHGTQSTGAPAALSQIPPGSHLGGRSDLGQVVTETREKPAKVAPSLAQMADRQAAAMTARVATQVRLSRLDTFRIDGRPIGDLTPREALAWAGDRERDVRFVRSLTSGLPAREPIRATITPEIADELFSRAERQA